MAGVRITFERSAPMLMEPSAPDAFEPEQPALSATRRHAEDARVLWDLGRHICYLVVSHFVLRVALAAHLAVNQGGECRYAASSLETACSSAWRRSTRAAISARAKRSGQNGDDSGDTCPETGSCSATATPLGDGI